MSVISGTRRGMKELVERFMGKTMEADSGCLEWVGCVTPNGYGAIQVGGVKRGAHRVAYELFVGEIPDGMFVCHRCDNTRCVRPDHLFVGTPKDNSADRDAKGRAADRRGAANPMWKGGPPPRPGKARGERNHTAKLRDADIPVIRERLIVGETVAEIARTYGVAWPQINRIKTGEGWKHV